MIGDSVFNNMKRNCVARALYDNVKESPDELAFKKGDLLTVLEQNTAGLEGWWLCSLRGMQGICPGNRLRIIPGCYDTGSGLTTLSAVQSATGQFSNSGGGNPYQRNQANKVVTPRRVGDIFAYDTPKSHHPLHSEFDMAGVARNQENSFDGTRLSRSSSLRCDSPRTNFRTSLEQYDTPKPQESQYDCPSSRPLYDLPKSALYYSPRPGCDNDLGEKDPSTPRSLIKGIRGGMPSSTPKPYVNQNQNCNQEYDIPRPIIHLEGEQNDTDRSSKISLMSCDSHLSSSSSASSLQASESLSLSSIGEGSSNRSSLESHDLYDVPPEPRKFIVPQQRPQLPPRESKDHSDTKKTATLEKKQRASEEVVYDVPPQVCRDGRPSDTVDSIANRISSGSECSGADVELLGSSELPLELNSAKDTLAKLEQDVLLAAERLSNLNRNTSKTSKDSAEEVKLAIFKLKESVRDFLTFGRGSSVNAFKSGEQKLSSRILKQIEPIDSMYSLICDAWKKLQITPLSTPTASAIAKDQSSQISSISAALNENIRQLNSLIHNNSHLIFKRSPTIEISFTKKIDDDGEKTPVQERPLPELPIEPEKLTKNESQAWLEDYDYVNLDSKESLEREHREMLETLPSTLKKSFDNLFRQSHLTVDCDHKKALNSSSTTNGSVSPAITPTPGEDKTPTKKAPLEANDKQVLEFYGSQSHLHLQNLNSAIDAFLLTIENNQPPKVFIAHSKFVILSAHKLVFIGDTVHRNVISTDVRTHVLNCSNCLCDAMKKTVAAAKTAALQFPSVTAVQAMVDAFVNVSQLANNLKKAICREELVGN